MLLYLLVPRFFVWVLIYLLYFQWVGSHIHYCILVSLIHGNLPKCLIYTSYLAVIHTRQRFSVGYFSVQMSKTDTETKFDIFLRVSTTGRVHFPDACSIKKM